MLTAAWKTRLGGFLVLAALVWAAPNYVLALPSLDPEDMAVVKVKGKAGKKSKVTVTDWTMIGDHANPNLFYVVPRGAIIAENKNGEPIFQLIRYQFERNNKSISGGIVNFGITMELPEDLEPLKEQGAIIRKNKQKKDEANVGKVETGGVWNIRRGLLWRPAPVQKVKLPDKDSIVIAPLVFKKCDIEIFAPGGGGYLTKSSGDKGPASGFPTQIYPFTAELNDIGANIYESLCTGNTGLNVKYNVEFDGITPKVGFKVTVNMKKLIEHFSADVSSRNKLAASFLGGAIKGDIAVGVDYTKARDALEEAKCTEIELLEGPGLTQERIKELMDPILKEMRDRMFAPGVYDKYLREAKVAKAETPEQAKAELGGSRPWAVALSSNTNIAISDFSSKVTAKEEFIYSSRKIQSQAIVFGGFVGVGAYFKSKKIEDVQKEPLYGRLVVDARDGFNQSLFRLPAVSPSLKEAGVIEIKLEIVLHEGATKMGQKPTGLIKSKTAVYTPSKGEWSVVGEDGPSSGNILFVLNEHRKKLKNLYYHVTTTVRRDGAKPLTETYEIPCAPGDKAFAGAEDNLRFVKVSPGNLDFSEIAFKRFSVAITANGVTHQAKEISSAEKDAIFLVLLPGTQDLKYQVRVTPAGAYPIRNNLIDDIYYLDAKDFKKKAN